MTSPTTMINVTPGPTPEGPLFDAVNAELRGLKHKCLLGQQSLSEDAGQVDGNEPRVCGLTKEETAT